MLSASLNKTFPSYYRLLSVDASFQNISLQVQDKAQRNHIIKIQLSAKVTVTTWIVLPKGCKIVQSLFAHSLMVLKTFNQSLFKTVCVCVWPVTVIVQYKRVTISFMSGTNWCCRALVSYSKIFISRLWVCVFVSVCEWVSECVCEWVCVSVCVCVCVCVCECVCDWVWLSVCVTVP